MDEIQVALTISEFDLPFWGTLRSLGTNLLEGRLGYIISSQKKAADLTTQSGEHSPFFNIFGQNIQLGPFLPDEALELINSAPVAFVAIRCGVDPENQPVLARPPAIALPGSLARPARGPKWRRMENRSPGGIENVCASVHIMINQATIPAEQYTDSPPLKRRPILAVLQIAAWIAFHPSAWANHLLRIHPSLQPDFRLVDLSPLLWKKPALRRLLLTIYLPTFLLPPLLTWLILTASGKPAQSVTNDAFAALMYAIATGLGFATLTSVSAGAVMGFNIGLFMGLFGQQTAWLPLIYTLSCSVTGASQLNLTQTGDFWPFNRKIVGIGVGALVGMLFIGLVNLVFSGALFNIPAAPDPSIPSTSAQVDLTILSAGLLFFLACLAALRLRGPVSWRRSVRIALVFGMLMALGNWVLFVFPRQTTLVFIFASLAGGLFISLIYGIIHSFTRNLSGPFAAAVAGSVGASFALLPLFPFLAAGYREDPNTLWFALAIFFLGFSIHFWLPVILYPFIALHNTIIYRKDQRARGGPLEHFHRHAVYWFETQRLPWVGLVDYLVLLADTAAEFVQYRL